MGRTSRDRERSETLNYIQAMLGQLATMAMAERCNMLTYLIEMAYIEASDVIRGSRPRQVGRGSGSGTHEQGNRTS